MSDFAAQIHSFSDKAKEAVIEKRKQAQEDLGKTIVANHPVDTGLSSGNWIGNKDAPANYSVPLTSTHARNTDLSTRATFGEDGTWYLVNNVDYTYHIEFGSSTIMAHAMARKGVQSIADKLG